MTEEELDAAGALAVDEDQDELMEEMSIEERKERLKKARWNVFSLPRCGAICLVRPLSDAFSAE